MHIRAVVLNESRDKVTESGQSKNSRGWEERGSGSGGC